METLRGLKADLEKTLREDAGKSSASKTNVPRSRHGNRTGAKDAASQCDPARSPAPRWRPSTIPPAGGQNQSAIFTL